MHGFKSEAELEEYLSRPFPEDLEAVRELDGDYVLLGAGGKMGPTLAMRIRRALDEVGKSGRVMAVSRFSDAAAATRLHEAGVEIRPADLLDDDAELPQATNVIYLAGRKFGSTGQAGLTWMMNVVLPDRICRQYRGSRIAALSSGNIYPLVPVESGGASEETPVGPIGEYAQTVLGRERIFEHYAETTNTPTIILRLNYAVEPRYGVLVDLAEKIDAGSLIDVTMGHVNVLWQGDANSYVLRSLRHAKTQAPRLNLAGLETWRVRDLALSLGERLGKEPNLEGQEASTALLNNGSKCAQLLGQNKVSIGELLDWTATWLRQGLPRLGKPTHFEARDGKF